MVVPGYVRVNMIREYPCAHEVYSLIVQKGKYIKQTNKQNHANQSTVKKKITVKIRKKFDLRKRSYRKLF